MKDDVNDKLKLRVQRLKRVFGAAFLSLLIYVVLYFVLRGNEAVPAVLLSLGGLVPLLLLIVSVVVVKINSKCPYCDGFVYFGYLFYAKHCPKCREVINENGA